MVELVDLHMHFRALWICMHTRQRLHVFSVLLRLTLKIKIDTLKNTVETGRSDPFSGIGRTIDSKSVNILVSTHGLHSGYCLVTVLVSLKICGGD